MEGTAAAVVDTAAAAEGSPAAADCTAVGLVVAPQKAGRRAALPVQPAVALRVLAQRQTAWTIAEDYRLHHLICYLYTLPDIGLMLVYDVRDEGLIETVDWVDSDHGGDLRDARSTSGSIAVK